MVDPVNITDYNLSNERLEEYILFCIAVAGKNALTTSRNLERLLQHLHWEARVEGWKPFEVVRRFSRDYLSEKMKEFGIGCYGLKSIGFYQICRKKIDLRACTPAQLEECDSIGPKTSRFFILHTRKKAKVACLDTHILKWLKELGHDVPGSSPQSTKKYAEIEAIFLEIARKKRMSPAKLDLMIWRKYSGNAPQNQGRAA